MVLALDLPQRVAHRLQEVLVGAEDGAVEVELDHRLALADGGELALVVGRLELGGGDVGGVLHHLERLAAHVEDLVVARLDPDLAAVLGDPPVLAGIVFAAAELLPELLVLDAAAVGGLGEHRVVLALHFLQRVAQRLQEVAVGAQDVALEVELDHRLALADGGDLAGHVGVAQLLGADVGGVLHHLEGLALGVEDRVVAGLDPDFLAALAVALVLAGVVLAAPQPRPERAVFLAASVRGIDEHRVVLAAHLLQRVADRGEEVRVGVEDGAVERELDHRLRAVDGGELALHVHPAQQGLAGGARRGGGLLRDGLFGGGLLGGGFLGSGSLHGVRPFGGGTERSGVSVMAYCRAWEGASISAMSAPDISLSMSIRISIRASSVPRPVT